MLGSINPLGERARGSRWKVSVSAFLLASTLAGGALGGVLGWAGQHLLDLLALPGQARLWVLGIVIAVGVGLDARLIGSGPPGPRRQVNEEWLYRYRGWVYGLGFGFQLGLGFATIVVLSAVYATFAAAFLSASFVSGAWIGGVFGFARGGTALSVAAVRRADQLALVDARLRRWDSPSRRWAVGSELALLTASAVAAFL